MTFCMLCEEIYTLPVPSVARCSPVYLRFVNVYYYYYCCCFCCDKFSVYWVFFLMFIDDCCRIHWNRPKATQESLKSCEIPQLLDLIWLSITNVLICFTESEPVEASRVDDKATECVAEVEETQSEAVETPTEVEETQAEVSQDAVVADVASDVASPSTAHQSNTTRVSENWSKMILEDHWWLGNNSHFFESQSKLMSSAKELQKMLQTASLRVPEVLRASVSRQTWDSFRRPFSFVGSVEAVGAGAEEEEAGDVTLSTPIADESRRDSDAVLQDVTVIQQPQIIGDFSIS